MIADPGLDIDRQKQERETHLKDAVRAIQTGRLVVFMGAGANACSRPTDLTWNAGQREHLPLGKELANHLAETFGYPFKGREDLARVSQWVALDKGVGPLFDELHLLFDIDYPTTPLHSFLASLPSCLRAKGYPRTSESNYRRLLIVTTNYDDMLERAFAAVREPVHVLAYQSEKENALDVRGKFIHLAPGQDQIQTIEDPNNYRGLQEDEHGIILKIHGAVDRATSERDSYVITEDHYLDYLEFAPTQLTSLLPGPLPALLRDSHLLFLGYGLKDWNLRVILRRLWRERKRSRTHWSIQRGVDDHDAAFWLKSDVKIIDWGLADYIQTLQDRVLGLPSLHVGTSA